jgi:hypothetical protein
MLQRDDPDGQWASRPATDFRELNPRCCAMWAFACDTLRSDTDIPKVPSHHHVTSEIKHVTQDQARFDASIVFAHRVEFGWFHPQYFSAV